MRLLGRRHAAAQLERRELANREVVSVRIPERDGQMQFRLVSDHVLFEAADVLVKPARGEERAGMVTHKTTQLRLNETDNIPDLSPGDIELVVSNCHVRLRASGNLYRIPLFVAGVSVSLTDVSRGRADVQLGWHAVVRVEAVDGQDQPLRHQHRLGFSRDWMSIEVKGPEQSPLSLLLPPGEYTAYVMDGQPIQSRFIVRPDQQDVLLVKIRREATESPQ
jgi:hypothetical protein